MSMRTGRPKQTHCKRGHERTPDNVYPSGSCKPCRDASASEWAKNNPEKARIAQRKHDNNKRLKRFGLTVEDVRDTCQVCGETNGSKKSVCVDHCHVTGRFRGFLCDRCNKILGFTRDDPKLLEKLALYLREV